MDKGMFGYLQPTAEQIRKMDRVRSAFAELHAVVVEEMPSGPDATYVVRKLRDCAMWANVGITRQPDGAPRG